MDFNNLLNEAKNKVSVATNGKSDVIIADNLAKIQLLFKTKAGETLKAIASDDHKMTEISKFVYGELPLPFRLITKEDVFVDFCLKNRDKVLGINADV